MLLRALTYYAGRILSGFSTFELSAIFHPRCSKWKRLSPVGLTMIIDVIVIITTTTFIIIVLFISNNIIIIVLVISNIIIITATLHCRSSK